MVDSRITGNESGFFTTENEFRQVGLSTRSFTEC